MNLAQILAALAGAAQVFTTFQTVAQTGVFGTGALQFASHANDVLSHGTGALQGVQVVLNSASNALNSAQSAAQIVSSGLASVPIQAGVVINHKL